MEEKVMELSWPDVLKVASGQDSAGLPRSAASLAIERIINENETDVLKECFFEGATINVHASGGAVVVTADFPYTQAGIFRQCKKLCDDWMKDVDEDTLTDQQLSLCVAPFALEGQIVLFYNQLMFVDGYDVEHKSYRLILGFDNAATVIMEAENIDYNKIQAQISEELRYYEQQLDEEIAEAIEEERQAKEQENIIALEMQEKLNNPIDFTFGQEEKMDDLGNIRFTEEEEKVRFVEDD